MKSKNINSFLSIIFVLTTVSNIGQNLAKIGNIEISPQEYKVRYELTPKINDDYSANSKINFLYSLMAEKLWAQEAKALSMDTIPYVYNSSLDIEKKLVRDKLYKIEVENKVKVSEEEVLKDIYKVTQKRILKFLHSNDKAEIEYLFERLNKGASFDSLLQTRSEKNQQPDGIEVVYGQLKEDIENKVFSIKINEFTNPINIENNWVIYYLVKVETIPLPKDNRERAIIKRAEDVIFARRAKVYYDNFYNKTIRKQKVNTYKILSEKLAHELYSYFANSGTEIFNKYKKKYELDSRGIIKIKNSFSNIELSTEFVKFENSPIDMNEYLIHIEINGFSIDVITQEAINRALNKNIKTFIFEEIIVREGYRRGLNKSKDVIEDLESWEESFLASYYRHTLLDSIEISEAEMRNIYNKILAENDSLTTKSYDEVRELIEKGAFFNKLEDKYIDKTVSLASKYGISVDNKLLDEIQVTKIEMMVYRNLGFGGEISAVPYLTPFYNWKNWLPKSLKQSLP